MRKILGEIGTEFLNVLFGNVYTKTGLSLMLLIVGLVFIFAPMSNKIEKPKWFYIIGSLLVFSSILLIIKRYSELNRKQKKL